ncbi:LysM peptidoglycan-binding domain-containing protein [Kitasatospora sp. NPDC087861]|uniref:LysM peptidoglycan-binding domain-containing protein n=1 Tax=Kitasatospora sp. NPDC087861 TaxID=3364070 RepID=UPI003821755C
MTTALRRLAAVLRALTALLVLIALLAALPALLWLFTTTLLPHGVSPAEIGALLTQRQNVGTPLLAVLLAAGWLSWAAFAGCVLLEVPRQITGRPSVRLPALGGPQRIAAFLVGAILVALPAGNALASPTPANAATARPLVAATAPQTPTSGPATAVPAPATDAAAPHGPSYTVRERDSLWSIAEHQLGDGTHWREIADLNTGRTMADGSAFNPDVIQPGWTLALPENAAPTPTPAPTTGSPAGSVPAAAGTGTTGTVAAQDTDWPTHTVQDASETPWDLAVRYLGDGQRWPDIAALNPVLANTPPGHALPQGTVLKLPADARPSGPTASAPTTNPSADPGQTTANTGTDTPGADDARPAHVTVQAGDSLWTIAEHNLGDGTQWPALFDANKDKPQPDGGRFTDPDLVYPGQELDLPPAAPPASTGQPATPTTARPDSPAPDATHQQDTPPMPAAPAPSPAPSTSVPAPAAPAPTVPAAPATDTPVQATAAHAPNRQQHPLAPAAAFAGAGALAAAFITTLALRRRLQQRRLRPGRHIPLPTGRAAATEQSLRAAQRPGGFDLLDRTLRTLALNLAAEGRELPALDAVVLSESRVDLHLADAPAAGLPAAPFTAAADRLWTCPATSTGIADDERLAAADAPYPALVSIGHDTRDRLVLVDLEHIGILHLAGDQDSARHVLQAVAVEIATSPLPAHLEVEVLDGAVPGLENAVPDRVRRAADPARAVESLLAHATGQHHALAAAGAESLRAARLSEASDSWAPRILLAAGLPEGDDTGRLLTALDQRPRTAAAIVTASAPPVLPAPGCGWTLECPSDGSAVVLPGSGIPVVLQGLADEHLADAVDILVLAASPADAPAPDWITGTPGTDQQPPSVQGPDAAEDGLPAEYAELEDELADTEKAPAPRPAEPFQAPVPRPHTPTPPPPASVPAAGPTLADVLAGQDDIPAPATVPAPVAAAVRRPLPTPAPEKAPDGPSVLVLGPVAIEGAAGQVDSNRRRTATELIAYLALNPGVDHHSLDAALWPGQIVSKQVRNAAISRARSWLGSAPDAALHLPRVQDTDDNRYRLADTVDCDWTRFLHHTRTGLADTGEDGDLALRRALALVRGRPFTGTDPTRYTWAEPAIQTMVSTITHAAHELSTRRLDAHDVPGALWAAKQGLLAGEENETLHRCLFRAHHAAGDTDALRTAAATLSRINNRLGDLDMEGETAALLHELLPRPLATR